MQAILLLLTLLPLLPSATAFGFTPPARRAPAPAAATLLAIAADGALLTLPGAPPTPTPTPTTARPPATDTAPIPADITVAPDAERIDLAEKFVQTTYYSCVTRGTYTHCGWHEPILDASSGAARGRSEGKGRWGVVGLLGVVVGGLVMGAWV